MRAPACLLLMATVVAAAPLQPPPSPEPSIISSIALPEDHTSLASSLTNCIEVDLNEIEELRSKLQNTIGFDVTTNEENISFGLLEEDWERLKLLEKRLPDNSHLKPKLVKAFRLLISALYQAHQSPLKMSKQGYKPFQTNYTSETKIKHPNTHGISQKTLMNQTEVLNLTSTTITEVDNEAAGSEQIESVLPFNSSVPTYENENINTTTEQFSISTDYEQNQLGEKNSTRVYSKNTDDTYNSNKEFDNGPVNIIETTKLEPVINVVSSTMKPTTNNNTSYFGEIATEEVKVVSDAGNSGDPDQYNLPPTESTPYNKFTLTTNSFTPDNNGSSLEPTEKGHGLHNEDNQSKKELSENIYNTDNSTTISALHPTQSSETNLDKESTSIESSSSQGDVNEPKYKPTSSSSATEPFTRIHLDRVVQSNDTARFSERPGDSTSTSHNPSGITNEIKHNTSSPASVSMSSTTESNNTAIFSERPGDSMSTSHNSSGITNEIEHNNTSPATVSMSNTIESNETARFSERPGDSTSTSHNHPGITNEIEHNTTSPATVSMSNTTKSNNTARFSERPGNSTSTSHNPSGITNEIEHNTTSPATVSMSSTTKSNNTARFSERPGNSTSSSHNPSGITNEIEHNTTSPATVSMSSTTKSNDTGRFSERPGDSTSSSHNPSGITNEIEHSTTSPATVSMSSTTKSNDTGRFSERSGDSTSTSHNPSGITNEIEHNTTSPATVSMSSTTKSNNTARFSERPGNSTSTSHNRSGITNEIEHNTTSPATVSMSSTTKSNDTGRFGERPGDSTSTSHNPSGITNEIEHNNTSPSTISMSSTTISNDTARFSERRGDSMSTSHNSSGITNEIEHNTNSPATVSMGSTTKSNDTTRFIERPGDSTSTFHNPSGIRNEIEPSTTSPATVSMSSTTKSNDTTRFSERPVGSTSTSHDPSGTTNEIVHTTTSPAVVSISSTSEKNSRQNKSLNSDTFNPPHVTSGIKFSLDKTVNETFNSFSLVFPEYSKLSSSTTEVNKLIIYPPDSRQRVKFQESRGPTLVQNGCENKNACVKVENIEFYNPQRSEIYARLNINENSADADAESDSRFLSATVPSDSVLWSYKIKALRKKSI